MSPTLVLALALGQVAVALKANSWQVRLDRATLGVDTKPEARLRMLNKVLRDPSFSSDVQSAVSAVATKGFKDGHVEAIETLFPKGTTVRSDLEGLQALRKQVPEVLRSPPPRPSRPATPPTPPTRDEVTKAAKKAVESLRDGSSRDAFEEELKNAFRSIPKGLESPTYKVERKFEGGLFDEGLEVRRYDAYLVAELAEARPDGDSFNVLAGYLFGKNSEDRAMSMTMPVEMTDGRMAFVLGSDAADAPEPLDDAVSVTTRESRVVAALAFPGVATPEEIDRQREKLEGLLADNGLDADVDACTILQYNAPYTIPWRRRNEIVVPLAEAAAPATPPPAAAAADAAPAPAKWAWSGPVFTAAAGAPPASAPRAAAGDPATPAKWAWSGPVF